MSRTLLLITLGAVTAIMLSAAVALLLLGLGYFQPLVRMTETPTPPIILSTATPTASPTLEPTATETVETTATPTSTAPPAPPTSTVPPTPIPVDSTTVQYVQALTDVNIRSGPGTGYSVVGWVAGGQTAKVTGVNTSSGWWRVVCPDGTVGSCWVTGARRYTQPSSGPVVPPTPTASTAPCTDRASFVADVTIPDNSQLVANTTFIKTWRIKNNGTCTWDGRYNLVHVGGSMLGAIVDVRPIPGTVAPGQTVDISLTLLAPTIPGSYQSDWKLRTPQNTLFGVGQSDAPLWVKIIVVAAQPNPTTISGLVYQDSNQNGVYNSGEPLMANRTVVLVSGTACHVRQNAIASTVSGSDGRYLLSGSFSGSLCLGLEGNGGLDDVVSIAVTAGQTLSDIHLKAALPSLSISGFVWSDTCLVDQTGSVIAGNCVPNGSGGFRANGMIEPTEPYIAGVTVLLRLGSCASDRATPVGAVTDSSGKYIFNNLTPGVYCVYINATAPENVTPLLPGDWTFPSVGVWYQEIELRHGSSAYPVNFGWDYQLQ